MTSQERFALLRRRSAEVLRDSADPQGSIGRPTGDVVVGDLFVFAQTVDFPVLWAVVDQETAGQRFLVVPADTNPLVGGADVAVPDGSSSGALSLRCGFPVWLEPEAFDPEMRGGSLPSRCVAAAQSKVAEAHRGGVVGSALERQVDTDPEYREWTAEVLEKAYLFLSGGSRPGHRASGQTVDSTAPGGSKWVGNPLLLAASILLVMTLGGGIVRQQWRIGEVLRVQNHAEEEHRRAMAALAQERERDLSAHVLLRQQANEQIAELEGKLEAADLKEPLVHVPRWLHPRGALRGESATVTLAPGAKSSFLLLTVDRPQGFPRHRLRILKGEAKTQIWQQSFQNVEATEIALVLPRDLLTPGDYRIELFGEGGDGPQLLAEYAFRLQLE